VAKELDRGTKKKEGLTHFIDQSGSSNSMAAIGQNFGLIPD
jgi:hypothetical protein